MSRQPTALVVAFAAPLALCGCHAGGNTAPTTPAGLAAARPGGGAGPGYAAPPGFDHGSADRVAPRGMQPAPRARRPSPAPSMSAPGEPGRLGAAEAWGASGGAPAGRAPATSGWPVPPPAQVDSVASADDGEGWQIEAHKAAREESVATEREPAAVAPRRDRPGLGTEWGEARYSPIHEVAFERASERPFSVATLFYNDRAGVDAMASYDARHGARLRAPVAIRPGVTVSIVGEDGAPLDALSLDGRVYVVGEAGRRYGVVLSNSTPHRVEVVLSVDGLDAVDGTAASVGKRGYLLAPWDSLTIDGFRRSDREVAAFRFGAVRDSYASRTGSDRNVGVVGIALFSESGSDWNDEEIERRRTAQPFSDARYAHPPDGWE